MSDASQERPDDPVPGIDTPENELPSVEPLVKPLGGALLALGFLIAAQIRSEAPRVQYSSQERTPLVQTVRDLQSTQDDLKAQILALETQIRAAEVKAGTNDAQVRTLNQALEEARIAAGLVTLSGPGVVLELDDGLNASGSGSDSLVSARDVRTVVNELWLAGAEAISVNNERLTPTSAILDVGASLLVNSAYLSRPYQVSAIGPEDLYSRLSASSAWVAFVRGRSSALNGIEIRVAEPKSVTVPAYAGAVNLRYAGAGGGAGGGSPSPVASQPAVSGKP